MVKNLIDKQPITSTLRENYMPYAMSVIVSRAIPEIDGFKPSHRKLLYTMYKMSLLTGKKTKSANIVGQTMKLNPHGDMAIYETMVRMTKGNESLLMPYVDSKGSFGKHYSRDMAFASSRYTEAKLDESCNLLFDDIDKNTVDFVDNYDSTMKEPTLFPVAYPTILANPNQGIAVGMACNICSFNLVELCETTIAIIKNKDHKIASTLFAPDFTSGGEIIYDESALNQIYDTGRGSIKVKSVYNYDKKSNCIDITEIPYSTTAEAIIDKVVDLVKLGKIKEITDIRDETDLKGLKITIDLKRGTDADKLMQKLFKLTPLIDSFACNFNILINGHPKVMGVSQILNEWIIFRANVIKRRIVFDLDKKEKRLHLLEGLSKILLDINKAIKIIQQTEKDAEVVPNLMAGFRIDEIQAEYIAEIKLRNLNKQYILNATKDMEKISQEITELKDILNSENKIHQIIIKELKDVIRKYGQERKTKIIYEYDMEEFDADDLIEDYPVNVFFTREGYFKKITPLSLRMSGEQKLKTGDEIFMSKDCMNRDSMLVFTNKFQVYKSKLCDFDDTKSSVLGEYLPNKLGMDTDEIPISIIITNDYSGNIAFCFDNGRIAKIPLISYETKTNRKKLSNAYCDKFNLISVNYFEDDTDLILETNNNKILCVSTSLIPLKTSRSSQGVIAMTLRGKNTKVISVLTKENFSVDNLDEYRTKAIPSSGKTKGKDAVQLSLIADNN